MTMTVIVYHAPEDSLAAVTDSIHEFPPSMQTALNPTKTTVLWRSREGVPRGRAVATITDSEAVPEPRKDH